MSDQRVVVDSGPLIALSAVSSLGLLRDLYSEVMIPDAVFEEVVVRGEGRAGAQEVREADWLLRMTLDRSPEPLLAKELGAGEAEVITLASRRKADIVLLDEAKARRVARDAYGLKVRGSAAVLVAAKNLGLLSSVRPLLHQMRSKGYRLSDRVIRTACEAAGEPS